MFPLSEIASVNFHQTNIWWWWWWWWN